MVLARRALASAAGSIETVRAIERDGEGVRSREASDDERDIGKLDRVEDSGVSGTGR